MPFLYVVDQRGNLYQVGDEDPLVTQNQVSGTITALNISRSGNGFSLLNDQGMNFSFGDAPALFKGEFFGAPIAKDAEISPDGRSFYILTDFGPVHTYNQAVFLGSPYFGTLWHPLAFARDFELTPTGRGYYVLDCWGNVYAFGDAVWYGNAAANCNCNNNLAEAGYIDLELAPDGRGYFITDINGYVTGFGSGQTIAKELEPAGLLPGMNRNTSFAQCSAVDMELMINCATQAVEGWWILSQDGTIQNVGLAYPVPAPGYPLGTDRKYQDLEVIYR